MTPLLWLAVATSAVWLLAALRCPEARPIAATLALVTLVDVTRLAPLPVRWDMALWLAHPVVSAWCVWRVLR